MATAGVLMVLLAGWWLESQNVRLRRELARSTATAPGVDASRDPSETAENLQARSGFILTAILSPGLTKSLGESQPRDIRVDADVKEMRLQFDLPGATKDYTVKLEIMRVDAATRRLIFTRQRLETSAIPAGRTVLVALSANDFISGDYIAFVSVDSGRALEETLGSYSFRVLRQ
jgi:hypothetical protein